MGKTLYLESSIISYLCARRSRDLVQAARQEITWRWWDTRRADFDLYISQLVVREVSAGDPDAAAERLALLHGITLLDVDEDAEQLAQALLTEGPLPQRAAEDAVHLAVAAVQGLDYLLTWNCRHLANAEMLPAIESLVRSKGYRAPLVCVPDELLGEQ